MSEHEVDARGLTEVNRELVGRAAITLGALCDPSVPRFWRNTEQRERVTHEDDAVREPFPTVSLCCAQALLRLQLERPQWLPSQLPAAVLEAVREIPLNHGSSTLAKSSLAAVGRLPPFSVAQHLQALSALASLHPDVGAPVAPILGEYASHPSTPLHVSESGLAAHPFVLYHLLKAAQAAASVGVELPSAVEDERVLAVASLERDARFLLGQFHMGRLSPDQVVALAFCGCGLALAGTEDLDPLSLAALTAAASGQEASGCWALGRLVAPNKDVDPAGERIEISTYEISWAIADAVLRLIERRPRLATGRDFEAVYDSLNSAASYAQQNEVALPGGVPPTRGWCSDHPYRQPIIESWTSATVLQSALSLQLLIEEIASQRTLQKFSVSPAEDPTRPSWLRWSSFRFQQEMDSTAKPLAYIHAKIVAPILESVRCLPDPGADTVSALLFGPPGTSKTSIVRAVAEGLSWPLIQLSPGAFIERGLELIEAQARVVFDDLLRVQRAVVIFDECDELFRERGPQVASEQLRSITAFVTASMLPKLQQLHDQGRVVFFICTNNFDMLDSAVKRRGRVDHIIGIGPPDEAARRSIVEATLGAPKGAPDAPGVQRLILETERFSRGELVALAKLFAESRVGGEADEQLVAKLIRNFNPSVTITPEMFESFRATVAQYSHPHLALGAS